MNWQEVQNKARQKINPEVCRVCPVCNGVVCRGKLPGMGGVGTGASFVKNYQALAEYKLNLHTLHDVTEPRMSVEIFGKRLAVPVILGAVAGVKTNRLDNCITEEDLAESWLLGAKMGETLAMTGDGPDPSLYAVAIEASKKNPGIAIPIIKPRPQEEILTRIKEAEEAGAVAVGIDIDAAALIHNVSGLTCEPKTIDKIIELVESTHLPFVLKGIMTVEDAETAYQAGVKAIVVSNHGGRALDHCPGTAEVLPDIAQAVGDKMTVLVDGAIRTGIDVLKCLALGAHGVLVGRPPTIAAIGGGAEGIKAMLDYFKADLRKAMILTGTKDVQKVSKSILYNF
ncbi:MAG: alpha-hydroxy-acid oxidizing protein [Clostridia bacterium]|nr:alpha-hydroxy-acid oxidizing protein [Clostridia bacterium]